MSAATPRRRLSSDLIATLLVAAFSMTVALGYARVFSAWTFVTDMAVIVAVGHGVGLLVRRLGVLSWIAVPVMALSLVWIVLAVYYRDTFSWALPTGDTWSILGSQLTSVRSEFRTAVAPVYYGGGWDVLAAIGVAAAVLLADVFAFRADARAETLVPGGVLFIFVGALGDERLRVASAVVLVGVGVVTTVGLRWYHAGPGHAESSVSWRRWPTAIAFGVVVAIAAGIAGPRLPGADAAPLYETSGRGGGVTQVVSPLVDIRSRLTNQSNAELFRVSADVESYWRSSALPEFNGTTWGLPERELQPVDESATPPPASLVENRQRIVIGALGGTLVPAAPDPFQATGPDDLRWVPETSTLVTVDGDLETGDTIDIVSAAPRLDAARLAAATSNDPGDAIYTDVPSDLPEVVNTTVRQVTAGAQNPYEAALALQAWFQTEFDYSLEVQPGHDGSAIESFLRDRVGYCEQFAGTYAAMLRTVGIPTRVAVGFTSGATVADGEFSVLGRNAHAWPEVWFDDIGWVAFEPTPGRGAPNAENYTGIPPQQDATTGAAQVEDATVAPTTTVATGATSDRPGLEIPEFADPTGGSGTNETTSSGSDGGAPWGWLALGVLAVVVAAAPKLIRSLRSRATAQSVDQQISGAWRRASAAVMAAGVPVRPSDTPREIAASTALHFPVATRPMRSLADVVTEATFRDGGSIGLDKIGVYGASAVSDCRNWAKQIDRTATESLDRRTRIWRYFTSWP